MSHFATLISIYVEDVVNICDSGYLETSLRRSVVIIIHSYISLLLFSVITFASHYMIRSSTFIAFLIYFVESARICSNLPFLSISNGPTLRGP